MIHFKLFVLRKALRMLLKTLSDTIVGRAARLQSYFYRQVRLLLLSSFYALMILDGASGPDIFGTQSP